MQNSLDAILSSGEWAASSLGECPGIGVACNRCPFLSFRQASGFFSSFPPEQDVVLLWVEKTDERILV